MFLDLSSSPVTVRTEAQFRPLRGNSRTKLQNVVTRSMVVRRMWHPVALILDELLAVSLTRAAWVKRCWLPSFGRNLPGLASGR